MFDTRKATLLGVVAGFGKGVAVSKTTGARTYMNMGTGGVGLAFGFGGFESPGGDPVPGRSRLSAGSSRKAMTRPRRRGRGRARDKAEEMLRFQDGRSIFVLGKNGWRVNATAAGTKYWAAPDLNSQAGRIGSPGVMVPPSMMRAFRPERCSIRSQTVLPVIMSR